MERSGYGYGKGMGYKNLVPKDPYIHSLNAKGIKTKKSKTPHLDTMKERKDFWSVVSGKAFRKDFGMIATPQKRGLIRELAKKVVQGVEWAKEWEKEHLPAQKEWVKKEFNQAKEEAIKLEKVGIRKIKEWKAERELRKEGFEPYNLQKKQDLDDVRDELDIDNNGTQDISMAELNRANRKIVSGLDTIDLNNNDVPDHQEEGFTNLSTMETPLQPSYTEPSEEVLSNKPIAPIPFMTGDQEPPEPEPDVEPFEPLVVEPPRPKKKNVLQKAGEFAKKEYGAGREYLRKRQENIRELHQLPDATLKQLAVEEGAKGLGLNKYEKELIRREKEKLYLEKKLKDVKEGKTTESSIGSVFGFLNPVATLSRPKQPQKAGESSLGESLSFLNPLTAFKQKSTRLKPKVQRLNDGFEPFGFLNPIKTLRGK